MHAQTNNKNLVSLVRVLAMAVEREELLEAIVEVADGKSPPTLERMNEHGEFSSTTYYNHFESWNEALREAGFEANHSPNNRVEKECEICEGRFEVVQSYTDARFCSQECYGVYRSEEYVGESHPRYTERVTVECGICSTEKEVTEAYAEEYDRHFCSNECMGEARREGFEGESNPNWTEEIEVSCENCGSNVERLPFQVEPHEWHFCSRSCQREWFSENLTGERNPNWRGGRTQWHNYGPRWESVRENIITQHNGECYSCGIGRGELETDLHVHHIIPLRKFEGENGGVDWERANQDENLTALCPKCHRKWEGIPVIPEIVG